MKIKIYKKLVQGSDEWFQVRLGKFGSTDASAVATNGKGLETLCYKKVAEIITGKFPESYTNPDMERGILLESMARSVYEIETGNPVKKVGYVEIDQYIGGSPDGLIDKKGGLEIKCPNDYNYVRLVCENKVPSGYMWQMQHLLYITKREWWDFVNFSENLNKIHVMRVERDEKMIKKLVIGLNEGTEQIKKILEKFN